MKAKQMSSTQLQSLLIAAIVFVIGILFSCSMLYGVRGLSFLIGFTIAAAGVMFMINGLRSHRSLANMESISGSILAAFGIMFIVKQLASIIVSFIPWGLVAVGICLLIDTRIGKATLPSSALVKLIVEFVIGVIAVVLGICLLLIPGFSKYAPAMLGIVMIVYSIFMIFGTLTQKDT